MGGRAVRRFSGAGFRAWFGWLGGGGFWRLGGLRFRRGFGHGGEGAGGGGAGQLHGEVGQFRAHGQVARGAGFGFGRLRGFGDGQGFVPLLS